MTSPIQRTLGRNKLRKDPTPMTETARLAYASLIALAREDCPTFCELMLKDEETGNHIQLQDFQLEWHDILDEHKYCVLWAFPESGKAVPLDTPIPTPDGWVTMGDLQVGDRVFGRDGRPCSVTWCSPTQHDHDVFEVTFDDGSSTLADADHRWLARSRSDRVQGKPYRVVTTRELTDCVLIEADGRTNWSMPIAGPVHFPEKDLPIDPYVLGVWLGDGTSQSSELTIGEGKLPIVERCRELEGVGEPYPRGACMAVTLGPGNRDCLPMRSRLRRLGLLNNKHIPGVYLEASISQRLELLRGLLDTDGTVATGQPTAEFGSSRSVLVAGAVELIRSLGFKANVRRKKTWRKDHFTVSFTTYDVRVFNLERKHRLMVENAEKAKSNGTTEARYVKEVRAVPTEPVKCITVNSSDNTYLMTEDFIVTHNTQQLVIARILWLLGRDNRRRYAILSATQGQSKKIIRTIQSHIVENQVVHDVFPGLKRGKLWTDNAIEVERPHGIKDPSVQAYSPEGGTIQGARLDGIAIDDVLTEINTRTRYQREKVEEWIRASAFSRLSDGGWCFFLTNAWHPDDMAHTLERQGWSARRYPVLDEQGKSVWPERWPEERIERTRVELLGPLEFARQMLCRARDDSESRFRQDWIDQALENGEGLPMVTSLEDLFERCPELAEEIQLTDAIARLGGMPEGLIVVTGVDLGVSRRESADLTALFTLAVRPDGMRHVLEVAAGRWTGPEIIDRVISAHERYRSIVVVENNAAQDFLLQWVRERAPGLRVRSFTTGRNKLSPEYGVESLAAELAAGQWIIPCERVTKATHPQVAEFITEMLYYDPGAHTGDRLMAAWIAREAARLYTSRRSRQARRSSGRGARIIGG